MFKIVSVAKKYGYYGNMGMEINTRFFIGLAIVAAATFAIGLALNRILLRLGPRWGLVAAPSARRRHPHPTPMTGGIGVIGAWISGLLLFGVFFPAWNVSLTSSMTVLLVGVGILMAIGLWDDVRELGAIPKLVGQTLAAAIILGYEPNIHALVSHWEETVGIAAWIFALLWIVGITNCINLIDGLDGLATGMSMLVAGSIFVLGLWIGAYAGVSMVSLGILMAALAAFLRYNWYPARAFLGDHGSLPIGFLLAASTLMGYAQSKSWVMVLSMLLMLGYPMMDMGLCVLLRYRTGFPLFKADRNHIHFRILRLGLSVPETAILLLFTAAYLQIAAVSVNLMSPPAAALGMGVVTFSLLSFLFLVRSLEKGKVSRAFSLLNKTRFSRLSREKWVLTIDLSPIFENRQQAAQAPAIMSSFELMLRSLVRQEDLLTISGHSIAIHFHEMDSNPENVESVNRRFQEKLSEFVKMFNFECTTCGLPTRLEKRDVSLVWDTAIKDGSKTMVQRSRYE